MARRSSTSPLRRAVATMGLAMAALLGWRLWQGELTLAEAGTRALVTMLVVVVTVRVLTAVLARAADMLEQADGEDGTAAG